MSIELPLFLIAIGIAVWLVRRLSSGAVRPWSLVLVAATGWISMSGLGLIDDGMLHSTHPLSLIHKAVTIASIEETGKLLAIIFCSAWLLRPTQFTAGDGLLLGQILGLGMALEESQLYASLQHPTFGVLGGELIRLVAHSLMAGIIGFAVASEMLRGQHRPMSSGVVLLSLAFTIVVHGTWNLIAYDAQPSLLLHTIPMILMLGLMLCWKWLCLLDAPSGQSRLQITTELHQTA